MPYDPTTPTLVLCDNLVTELGAAWGPVAPDGAQRCYLSRIDLSTVKGRQVFIFPEGYGNFPASRGHDFYDHRLMVLVFRRYEPAADETETVPQEWVDQEVDFVHTYIVQGFEYGRDGTQPTFNRNLQTLEANVPAMYDAEKLNAQKEFYCVVTLVLREQRTAA